MSDQFPPPSSYGTPPSGSGYGAPPPGYPPTGQPYGYQPPADHPRATTILVLGILSLVCCGLFAGIPAWVMGGNALKEIDASGGRIGGRGTVKAGWICGIIGTAISALVILFYIGMFAILGFSGELDSSDF